MGEGVANGLSASAAVAVAGRRIVAAAICRDVKHRSSRTQHSAAAAAAAAASDRPDHYHYIIIIIITILSKVSFCLSPACTGLSSAGPASTSVTFTHHCRRRRRRRVQLFFHIHLYIYIIYVHIVGTAASGKTTNSGVYMILQYRVSRDDPTDMYSQFNR